jgi:hypothetical protein
LIDVQKRLLCASVSAACHRGGGKNLLAQLRRMDGQGKPESISNENALRA